MNYCDMMTEQIEGIQKTDGHKPSLLLHTCCAPCSSAVLELLSPVFAITLYYYNPNIQPTDEYIRRLLELRSFASRFPIAQGIRVVGSEYRREDFYTATSVLQDTTLQAERERGERCARCYAFRLKKSFEHARTNHFDYVTTTLSISPHKDAEKINAIGTELEAAAHAQYQSSGPKFLYADFKKQEGYKRSLLLSKKYGLYRQNYCGCEFSEGAPAIS